MARSAYSRGHDPERIKHSKSLLQEHAGCYLEHLAFSDAAAAGAPSPTPAMTALHAADARRPALLILAFSLAWPVALGLAVRFEGVPALLFLDERPGSSDSTGHSGRNCLNAEEVRMQGSPGAQDG